MKAVLFMFALLAAGFVTGTAPAASGTPSLQIVTDGPLCICVVGASHTHVFTAHAFDTNGPFAWAVVDGALAPGKRLEVCSDGLTALVRGIALEPGVFQFTLAVWSLANPDVRSERAYSVELLPAAHEASPDHALSVAQSRLPIWLPVTGGVAVALSLLPLLRPRRRRPLHPLPQGVHPCD